MCWYSSIFKSKNARWNTDFFIFILVLVPRICETAKYALANSEAWLNIWLWEAQQIGSFPDTWRRKQSHIPKRIFMTRRRCMKCEKNKWLLQNITNHHQHPVRFLKILFIWSSGPKFVVSKVALWRAPPSSSPILVFHSITFHHCFVLIFIKMAVLPEGQTAKPGNFQKPTLFRKSGGTE